MKILICTILLAASFSSFSQTPAFDKNEELGRGINLGNMFEAPSENEWGNPFNDEYMQLIADLGFDHVRIPIRWEPATRSMTESPYTIDVSFLQRIQHVVDLALQHKLHPIINMHHHEELFENPDEQEERFLAMWKQISIYFSAYSDSLVFELLNEPHGNLTAEKWNTFLAEAIEVIHTNNPNRFILVGTAEYGGLGGLSKLILPEDDHLILTMHYYNPFSFTHQGAEWVGSEADQWLGTEWFDTESERQAVQSEFAAAIQFSTNNNIPIHVGEFGAYSKADMNSRVRWTTYLSRYFESLNFSWAYWEFSAGFGIYNPSTQNFQQELLDALLHNPMPEATPVNRKEIKKTEFEEDNNREGWNLYNNNGASSTGEVSQGEFSITIEDAGTESWHIQLALNNLVLENGKTYEVQVRAKSAADRSISVYTGMNHDPWTSYSGYSNFNLDTEYQSFTMSFQMQSSTDTEARLVIDLGNSNADISIDEIALYEVSLETSSQIYKNQTSSFYPNPASKIINFTKADDNSAIMIYTISGKLLQKKRMPDSKQLNLEPLPQGEYLIQWQTNNKVQSEKLIKLN